MEHGWPFPFGLRFSGFSYQHGNTFLLLLGIEARYANGGVPFMAALDWSQCPVVESVPGKVSGAWVLKGTRMPVSAIFGNLEAGANLDDIMEWYDGLDREQVKAVIEFAARSLDKPRAYAPQISK